MDSLSGRGWIASLHGAGVDSLSARGWIACLHGAGVGVDSLVFVLHVFSSRLGLSMPGLTCYAWLKVMVFQTQVDLLALNLHGRVEPSVRVAIQFRRCLRAGVARSRIYIYVANVSVSYSPLVIASPKIK